MGVSQDNRNDQITHKKYFNYSNLRSIIVHFFCGTHPKFSMKSYLNGASASGVAVATQWST